MQQTKNVPRIVMAAPHSGAGKTTIAAGLMAALSRRGLQVQPFKVGPDYIDPQVHHWATGRPGRNLDTWLMDPEPLRSAFLRGAREAGISVIEGVMGLYDGAAGTDERGSTAALAKWLQAPVVLVLDAQASARSLAAVALGFRMLDPGMRLAGAVANRVGGSSHAEAIREALAAVEVPLLGALPFDPELEIPEDRLGLALPGGSRQLPRWLDRVAGAVAEHVDLAALVALAQAAPPLPWEGRLPAATGHRPPAATPPIDATDPPGPTDPTNLVGSLGPADPFASASRGRFAGLRVGVAWDEAFWFYYPDTWETWQHWGVTPVRFSPLRDPALPPDLHGLYLGGGFPERHAATLAANASLRAELRRAWASGMPVYAEGGGYLYLQRELVGEDGSRHSMAGCLPGVARFYPRLQGLGYRRAEPGSLRGHVFHYSRVEGDAGPPAWELFRADGRRERLDGYRQGGHLAGYLHIHHPTAPGVMMDFLTWCQAHRRRADAAGLGGESRC